MAGAPLHQRRSIPGECSHGSVRQRFCRERNGGQRQRRSATARAWQDRLPGAGVRMPSAANVADAAGAAVSSVGASLSAPVVFVGTALAQPFARGDGADSADDKVTIPPPKWGRFPRLGLARGTEETREAGDRREVRTIFVLAASSRRRTHLGRVSSRDHNGLLVRLVACSGRFLRAVRQAAALQCRTSTCGRARARVDGNPQRHSTLTQSHCIIALTPA